MSELSRLTTAGRIATLTLQRPEARNALSVDLLRSLNAHAEALAPRPDVSVLILAGEDPAFCAGMDLKAVLDDPDAALALLTLLADFTIRLRALPMVTIARVNGAAIGGGCGLAMVCDIAVTHADSKMGFPEVDLGVCPAVVAPWLVRKIGHGRARAILLRAGLMTGGQALERGLVDHLVPGLADLDGGVADLAERLASGGPAALRATKALLNDLDGSLDAALVRRGAQISASVLAGAEARSALRAKIGGKGPR